MKNGIYTHVRGKSIIQNPITMIKASLIVTLIFSLALNLSGQTYHKLIEPDKTWYEKMSSWGDYQTYIYKIGNDTVFNGITY